MTTTMGIKMDDALKERVRQAAQGLERTPHWLVKQAVLQYVEALERGEKTIQLMPFTHNEAVGVTGSEGLVQPEAQPFLEFAQGVQPQTHLRAAITAAWNRPEPECLPFLLPLALRQRVVVFLLALVSLSNCLHCTPVTAVRNTSV